MLLMQRKEAEDETVGRNGSIEEGLGWGRWQPTTTNTVQYTFRRQTQTMNVISPIHLHGKSVFELLSPSLVVEPFHEIVSPNRFMMVSSEQKGRGSTIQLLYLFHLLLTHPSPTPLSIVSQFRKFTFQQTPQLNHNSNNKQQVHHKALIEETNQTMKFSSTAVSFVIAATTTIGASIVPTASAVKKGSSSRSA